MLHLIRNNPSLFLLIALGNIVLSIWCINADPVINHDGILYLEIAEQFKLGQWKRAFELYSWPFYSFFIYATSVLFQTSVEHAASIFNLLLAISLTTAFVSIVSKISNGNKSILIIACVLILAFPSINKYRSFIARDFGYLSFYLWSLYYLFSFAQSKSKADLFKWFIASAVSLLFRIEGFIFLYMVPCLLLYWSAQNKSIKRFFLCCFVLLSSLSLISAAAWFLSTKYGSILHQIQTSNFYLSQTLVMFYDELTERVGSEHSQLIGFVLLLGSILGTVLFETIRRLAIFYFFISFASIKLKLALQNRIEYKIWLAYILINLSLVCFFYFLSNVFVSRYAMPTVLTILLVSPFALKKLLNTLINGSGLKRYASIALFVLLSIASIKGLDTWGNNRYLITAGHWIKSNINAASTIYSNSPITLHYAQRRPFSDRTEVYNNQRLMHHFNTNKINKYDYFAFHHKASDKEDAKKLMQFNDAYGSPIHVLNAESDKRISIYLLH